MFESSANGSSVRVAPCHPVHDRRSALRINQVLPIRLFMRDQTQTPRVCEARTANVNLYGLHILMQAVLSQRDEQGDVEIEMSRGSFYGSVKVVWRDDERYRYGLKFSNLSHDQEEQWRGFLYRLNAPPPPDRRQGNKRRLIQEEASLYLKHEDRKGTRRMRDLLEIETVQDRFDAARADSIPRKKKAECTRDTVHVLREWLTEQTGVRLAHIGLLVEDPQNMRGNIENLIGAVQIPIGIAGPLKINGQYAKGNFYVPMATTEGTLVQSYHYGMCLLALSDGVTTSVLKDEIHISPLFKFQEIRVAELFIQWLNSNFHGIKQEAEKTTRHGKLVRLEPHLFDRSVAVKFCYTTGDASGLNIITLATAAACQYIQAIAQPKKFYFQANFSSIKKVAAHNFIAGYGKSVVAEAIIPAKLVKRFYNVTPEEVRDYFHRIIVSTTHAGMIGVSGHAANGMTAIFLACGQDVASVVESHVSVVNYEVSAGDLYASVKLPNLVLGTVGGGTSLATQRECLELLDCYGLGKAKKFAEIVASATLAGEISIFASNAAGTFAASFQNKRKRTTQQQ